MTHTPGAAPASLSPTASSWALESAPRAALSCERACARDGSLRTFPGFCVRRAFHMRAAASFHERRLRAAFFSSGHEEPAQYYCRGPGPAMDYLPFVIT